MFNRRKQAVEAPAETVAPETSKFTVRYERGDGQYREISLRAADHAAAVQIADRRLGEQFEDQDGYKLVAE